MKSFVIDRYRARFAAGIALVFLLLGAQTGLACSVSASSLNFPDYDPSLTYATTGIATLVVSCAATTNLTVEISGGVSSGGHRAMTHMFRPSQLSYGLFSDPAFTRPWGATPLRVVARRGARGEALLNIYGAIGPRQDAWVGTYSDYLTVTLLP